MELDPPSAPERNMALPPPHGCYKTRGLSPQVETRIPQSLARRFGTPRLSLVDTGPCIYDAPSNTILLSRQIRDPQVRQFVYAHEYGHYLHHKTGIVTQGHTEPKFARFMGQLRASIDPRIGRDFLAYADARGINLDDLLENEQFGCFFDLVGALTRGQQGAGHPLSYYQTRNNDAMEVFAHGAASAISYNPYIEEHFPSLVTYMEHSLKLPRQGPWKALKPQLDQYARQFGEPFPIRALPQEEIPALLTHCLAQKQPAETFLPPEPYA